MFFQVWIWTAQSGIWILAQKLRYEWVWHWVSHVLGESKWILENFLINFIRVLCILSERHIAGHELIQNNTQWPQVYRVIVTFSWQDLWGHVVWSTDNGESLSGNFWIDFLACSHINKFKVAVLTDHNILRFEVSVHDWVRMQCLESVHHDGPVKSWLRWSQ